MTSSVPGATRRGLGHAVGERLWPFHCPPLSAQARARIGWEDFGSPAVEPALGTLVTSLEREADLHPLGRFLMRMHLRGLLGTRLRLGGGWGGARGRAGGRGRQ